MLYEENCPDILNCFLNYLGGVRGYSINTIIGYKKDIMQFFNFIKIYNSIDFPVSYFNAFILLQIKEKDIIAFLIYSNFNMNNGPHTRQRKLSAIRSFYKWLLSLPPYQKSLNPTEQLPYIKTPSRLPRYLCLKEAKQLQEVFTKESSKFPERNNAIISLFLSSGIRLCELVNINVKDVNFGNKTIIIYGKNQKERTAYFSEYCKEKILTYLNTINNINITNALFTNRSGNRISPREVQTICKNAYKILKIDDLGYSTHTLRHTAATLMYKYVKDDVLLLKDFLGHSSLSSTQIYTHVDNKKLKDAAENHPLNNLCSNSIRLVA